MMNAATTIVTLALFFAAAANGANPTNGAELVDAITNANDGDTITLTSTSYQIPSTVNWNANDLTIEGVGAGSEIIFPGFTQAWGFDIDGVTGVTLRNLKLTGNGGDKPDRGLKIFNVDGVTLENVDTASFRRSGIDVHGCKNIVIDGGLHTDMGGHGLSLTDNINMALRNAVIQNSAWAGVSIANFGRYAKFGDVNKNVVVEGIDTCGNDIPFQIELNYVGPPNTFDAALTEHNGVSVAGENEVFMTYTYPARIDGSQAVLRPRTDTSETYFGALPGETGITEQADVDIRVTDYKWLTFGEPSGATNPKLVQFFCCSDYDNFFPDFADNTQTWQDKTDPHTDATQRAWKDIRLTSPEGGLYVSGNMDKTYSEAHREERGETIYAAPGIPCDGEEPIISLNECGCEYPPANPLVVQSSTKTVTVDFTDSRGACDAPLLTETCILR